MRVQIARFALGLALASLSLPAAAADWGGSGAIKDYGGAGGVPVPAPVPIPDYAPTWYFRLDAGLGVVSDPDLSESGYLYGADAIDGEFGPTRGFQSSWFESDFDTFLTLGGGVGVYVGRNWRFDATVEKRSKDDAFANGVDEYERHGYFDHDVNPATPPIWTADFNSNGTADDHTRVTISDTTKLKGTVWMLNAYYDLYRGERFTPYIGAGVGFVWNQYSRNHTTTTDYCDNEAAAPNGCAGGQYTGSTTITASDKAEKLSFAAAAMAGLTYDLTDMAKLDVGYRYLFLGGTDIKMSICCRESSFEIGDQHVHQVRVGLRFDVD